MKILTTIIILFLAFSPIKGDGMLNLGHRTLQTIEVSATCYFPSIDQCDRTPWLTASGVNINRRNPARHRWVAISRDLQNILKFGDRIFVVGTGIYDGYWSVQDVMNKRMEKHIDFLVGHDNYLDRWDNVTITILKKKIYSKNT